VADGKLVVPAQPLAGAKRASNAVAFIPHMRRFHPLLDVTPSFIIIGGSLSWLVCTTLASTFAPHRVCVSALNVADSSRGCWFPRVPSHQHNQHPQPNATHIPNATATRSEGSNSARVAVHDVLVRAGSSEPSQNPAPMLIPNTWCYL
jgi:hypothetical protein